MAATAAKPGSAVAKPKAGAVLVVNWEDELKKAAVKTAKVESVPGTNFSTKNGQLALNGNPIPGNMVEALIVDYNFLNTYFENDFDPKKPEPPTCFAFGDPNVDEDEAVHMAPHEDAPDKQHDDCGTCQWNKWNSAVDKNGKPAKGKRCKNSRRLALIPVDQLASVQKLQAYEANFLQLPVTSLNGWASYCQALAAQGTAPFGVVTEIKLVPDLDDQFHVTFNMKKRITDKAVGMAIIAKRAQVRENLYRPYTPQEAEAAAPAPKAKGGKKKY